MGAYDLLPAGPLSSRGLRSPLAAAVQPKLLVSHPGDALEREADAVADRVVAGQQAAAPRAQGQGVQRKCDACAAEDEPQKKPLDSPAAQGAAAAPAVAEVLGSAGQPLPEPSRRFFEDRLRYDFTAVRVHADPQAGQSAQALAARAYTLGRHIVFGPGQFAPATAEGRRLLAHELVHVIQQRGGGGAIQRACLSGAVCASPPGSSTQFGADVESREQQARTRRAAMSPARQRVHGHTGHARQLERFFESQSPGLLANVHGIFIDQDMDPDVAASTQDCDTMVPPILGATKPCIFVPGALNQQALTFNTNPGAANIGGKTREDWRISTLQTLVHEVQHVLYHTTVSTRPNPGGVASCNRADVNGELSELNAIISEFPAVFDAVPAGAPAADPARRRLVDWFDSSITNPGESIRGILTTIRCKCSCGDSDTFVRETFAFVTSSWPAARKDAFNAELRRPARGLNWPL